MLSRLLALVPLLAAVPAPSALAQWSGNPGVNLPIGDKPNEQNQPKIRATTGGGVYISWLDNATGGYDTYIQRLSVGGVEQYPHNGVLVADTAFSSTQDYGLAVDAGGNALVAYRDDRPPAVGTQVGVNKVMFGDGSLAWGPLGKVLTNTTDFIASPHVCATSDGFVVVAWTQGSNAMVQKLDAAGNTVWPAPVAITPASGSYTVTDVIPSDLGGVIVGLVKGTQRHLHTMKIRADGTPGWAGPTVIFDGSALQFGYFPAPKSDGVGGAVFAWYETGGTRNVYAQHINSIGMELFPHNGVAVSTDTSLIRLSPDFTYDNGVFCIFWTDTNQGQSQWGLSGQQLDAIGGRVWGAQPAPILPLSANQNSFVKASFTDFGPAVFCFDRSGNAQVIGFGLNIFTGAVLWTKTACSVLSGKARLDVCDVAGPGGGSRLAWGDARSGGNDIYAQNVGQNGVLGTCYPDCNGDGARNLSDFGCFQTKFALGDHYADCNGDTVLNLADFGCFQTKFALGCP